MKRKRHKNSKVLIIGAMLSMNQGSAAMAIVAWKLSSEFLQNPEISFLSPHPDTDRELCNRYGMKMVKQDALMIPFRLPGIMLEYSRADLIFSVHGDAYSDDSKVFGISWLPNSLIVSTQLMLGLLFRIPVIVMPQSIGPFRNIFTKNFVKYVLNSSKAVMVRGQITYNYLKSIGIKENILCQTSDLAFLLEASSQAHIQEIIADEGIDRIQKPLFGISISQVISRLVQNNNKTSRASYINIMVQLVDYLIETKNATILLISSVTGPRTRQDDRIIAREVREKVKRKENTIFIMKEYIAPEFRGLVGLCDLFIGARMHANIAALSMNVPTVAISYSHKTAEIMTQCGQEKYVCDFESMSFEQLQSKVDQVWDRRFEIKKELEINILKMRQDIIATVSQAMKSLAD
jgi:colanic acid/amylovoran biosynthesis protein